MSAEKPVQPNKTESIQPETQSELDPSQVSARCLQTAAGREKLLKSAVEMFSDVYKIRDYYGHTENRNTAAVKRNFPFRLVYQGFKNDLRRLSHKNPEDITDSEAERVLTAYKKLSTMHDRMIDSYEEKLELDQNEATFDGDKSSEITDQSATIEGEMPKSPEKQITARSLEDLGKHLSAETGPVSNLTLFGRGEPSVLEDTQGNFISLKDTWGKLEAALVAGEFSNEQIAGIKEKIYKPYADAIGTELREKNEGYKDRTNRIRQNFLKRVRDEISFSQPEGREPVVRNLDTEVVSDQMTEKQVVEALENLTSPLEKEQNVNQADLFFSAFSTADVSILKKADGSFKDMEDLRPELRKALRSRKFSKEQVQRIFEVFNRSWFPVYEELSKRDTGWQSRVREAKENFLKAVQAEINKEEPAGSNVGGSESTVMPEAADKLASGPETVFKNDVTKKQSTARVNFVPDPTEGDGSEAEYAERLAYQNRTKREQKNIETKRQTYEQAQVAKEETGKMDIAEFARLLKDELQNNVSPTTVESQSNKPRNQIELEKHVSESVDDLRQYLEEGLQHVQEQLSDELLKTFYNDNRYTEEIASLKESFEQLQKYGITRAGNYDEAEEQPFGMYGMQDDGVAQKERLQRKFDDRVSALKTRISRLFDYLEDQYEVEVGLETDAEVASRITNSTWFKAAENGSLQMSTLSASQLREVAQFITELNHAAPIAEDSKGFADVQKDIEKLKKGEQPENETYFNQRMQKIVAHFKTEYGLNETNNRELLLNMTEEQFSRSLSVSADFARAIPEDSNLAAKAQELLQKIAAYPSGEPADEAERLDRQLLRQEILNLSEFLDKRTQLDQQEYQRQLEAFGPELDAMTERFRQRFPRETREQARARAIKNLFAAKEWREEHAGKEKTVAEERNAAIMREGLKYREQIRQPFIENYRTHQKFVEAYQDGIINRYNEYKSSKWLSKERFFGVSREGLSDLAPKERQSYLEARLRYKDALSQVLATKNGGSLEEQRIKGAEFEAALAERFILKPAKEIIKMQTDIYAARLDRENPKNQEAIKAWSNARKNIVMTMKERMAKHPRAFAAVGAVAAVGALGLGTLTLPGLIGGVAGGLAGGWSAGWFGDKRIDKRKNRLALLTNSYTNTSSRELVTEFERQLIAADSELEKMEKQKAILQAAGGAVGAMLGNQMATGASNAIFSSGSPTGAETSSVVPSGVENGGVPDGSAISGADSGSQAGASGRSEAAGSILGGNEQMTGNPDTTGNLYQPVEPDQIPIPTERPINVSLEEVLHEAPNHYAGQEQWKIINSGPIGDLFDGSRSQEGFGLFKDLTQTAQQELTEKVNAYLLQTPTVAEAAGLNPNNPLYVESGRIVNFSVLEAVAKLVAQDQGLLP